MAFREFSLVRGSRGWLVEQVQKAVLPRYADAKPDGVLGPVTLKAMQDKIGAGCTKTIFTAADFPAFGLELVNTVDLSGHNEDRRKGLVDFDALKGAGCGHAIIKVSEGATYFNKEAARQFAEAARVGITVDAYHYNRPDIGHDRKRVTDLTRLDLAEADARLEIAWAQHCLTRAGAPPISTLYLDAESAVMPKVTSSQADRYNGRHLATTVRSVYRTVRTEAPRYVEAGVYTARWYTNAYLDDADHEDQIVIAGARGFIASYNAGITPTRLPTLFPKPVIWQYAGKNGRVAGVTGSCDLGVMVRRLPK